MEGKYHYKTMFFCIKHTILDCRDQAARTVSPTIWTTGTKLYYVIITTYKLKITLRKMLP